MKAMCGGELDGFCKGMGGIRPCPDHERVITAFERRMAEHEHGASPSHDEGAWCSYGVPSGCGLFLPLSAFTKGYAPPYFADVRGLVRTRANEQAPWQDEMRQEVYREMSRLFAERNAMAELVGVMRTALAKYEALPDLPSWARKGSL